jgi:hypothetical protein
MISMAIEMKVSFLALSIESCPVLRVIVILVVGGGGLVWRVFVGM